VATAKLPSEYAEPAAPAPATPMIVRVPVSRALRRVAGRGLRTGTGRLAVVVLAGGINRSAVKVIRPAAPNAQGQPTVRPISGTVLPDTSEAIGVADCFNPKNRP